MNRPCDFQTQEAYFCNIRSWKEERMADLEGMYGNPEIGIG